MNLFEQNMKIIKKNSNHKLPSHLPEQPLLRYVGTDKEEDFFVNQNNDIFILKDEIDEERLPNSLKKELIIVVGINAVNEIKQIIRKANNNSIIVIVEPNHDFLSFVLENKDLSFLDLNNVVLLAEQMSCLPSRIEELLSTTAVFLAANIRFYGTYYYRQYDLKNYTEIVKIISSGVKFKLFNIGNSIEDSLKGLQQNLNNLRYLFKSKDVSKLKNSFQGVPAIVVSAGPSLDKNIHYLKNAQGKAIIIAVDTIVQKLLDKGIIPDFMCSIERTEEVYKYFYKDKEIPVEISLVSPPVLVSEIFKEYKGEIIIPLRYNVGEYKWLNQLLQLNEESFISMGISSAHLAFGFANHLGASPIILIGQDLAYGNSIYESHSSGTIYDEIKFDSLTKVPVFETLGYNGEMVKTNQVWNDFRKWFELEIAERKIKVINSTEGGSRIENTIQLPLIEAISQYCKNNICSIIGFIKGCNTYKLDVYEICNKLKSESETIKEILTVAKDTKNRLHSMKIYPSLDNRKLLKYIDELKEADKLFWLIFDNSILRHNMQPEILNTIWKLNSIEEVLNYENVKENHKIQSEFVEVVIFVCNKIIEFLEQSYDALIGLED